MVESISRAFLFGGTPIRRVKLQTQTTRHTNGVYDLGFGVWGLGLRVWSSVDMV